VNPSIPLMVFHQ